MSLSAEIEGSYSLRSNWGTYLRMWRGPTGRDDWYADMAPHCRACEWWRIEDHNGKVVFVGNVSATPPGHPQQFLSAHPNGTVTTSAERTGYEEWTPEKRDDGSWSFRSAHGSMLRCCYDGTVTAEEKCEAWECFWLQNLDYGRPHPQDVISTRTQSDHSTPTAPYMDFFALPDVFIRKVMKTLKIKDRLRVRLTCRAFEKLVAETNAGYFRQGAIRGYADYCLNERKCLLMDNEKLKESREAEDQFIHIRSRLFDGISFGSFSIDLADYAFSQEFLQELTDNFKISKLFLKVFGSEQLDVATNIVCKFPNSMQSIEVVHVVEEAKLRSLPPLGVLRVVTSPFKLRGDLFFQLLNSHKSLDTAYVIINELKDWEKIIRVMSTDGGERELKVSVRSGMIVDWLTTFGIGASTKAGNIRGEVEMVRPDLMILHFRECILQFTGFSWNDGAKNAIAFVKT